MNIRRRIEVVITSRTRNAVVRKGTWVRIPPSPPKHCSAEGAVLFWRRQRGNSMHNRRRSNGHADRDSVGSSNFRSIRRYMIDRRSPAVQVNMNMMKKDGTYDPVRSARMPGTVAKTRLPRLQASCMRLTVFA